MEWFRKNSALIIIVTVSVFVLSTVALMLISLPIFGNK